MQNVKVYKVEQRTTYFPFGASFYGHRVRDFIWWTISVVDTGLEISFDWQWSVTEAGLLISCGIWQMAKYGTDQYWK